MELLAVTPVLRIFDVAPAKSFYDVDYLGCAVDWEDGDPPASPAYLEVSRGPPCCTSPATTVVARPTAPC